MTPELKKSVDRLLRIADRMAGFGCAPSLRAIAKRIEKETAEADADSRRLQHYFGYRRSEKDSTIIKMEMRALSGKVSIKQWRIAIDKSIKAYERENGSVR